MKLKDVMTENVEVVAPDTSLEEAARKMRDLDVGLLPVCDGERVVGMLSDRDLTIRATAEGRDPKTTPVRESMTPEVLSLFEDQEVSDAEQLMSERQVRRLTILNRDKRFVGIVSLGDVATKTDKTRAVGKTLEKVSETGDRFTGTIALWVNKDWKPSSWARLAERVHLEKSNAYCALRAALQTVRDRLPVDNAVHFGAQPPLLIQGLYGEGWEPSKGSIKNVASEFLATVKDKIVTDKVIDSIRITGRLFEVISSHVAPRGGYAPGNNNYRARTTTAPL
jgi:CBS domain-containing protein/uncharacterized protein (DUF2267 family)